MRAWLWWPDGGELHIFSRSVLVQDFIEKVMRRTVAPVECPAEPWMDFLVNEVSSRIPPLITRCDKCIQIPTFISNPLERRPHYFAGHHPLLTLDGFNLVSTLCLFSFIAKPLPVSS
ncbi:hypothetical protein TNCV_4295311 [Trichonephila clavipes]|uniref:Uncharacterized protein n=1 Tax=Trichonephila clavipes TaxID=2585209 RepID=A0A8X6RN12_TRICX|nr:hypothetical protein TNCV_4295311 [Trichonephila clavipes]